MNEFWKKNSQPANTGRVQYEWGYETAGTPSTKLVFPPSSQPSRLSSTIIGDFEFPPWKGREGDWIRGDLHQDLRLRDLDFQTYLHSLSQGTLIPDLIRSKWLGHDLEILSVEMLHYLSRSNTQSLNWIGWRLSEGPWLGLLSAHNGRVRYGTTERILLPCFNPLSGWFLGLSLIVYCVLWTFWPSLVEVITKHRIIILISIFQLI